MPLFWLLLAVPGLCLLSLVVALLVAACGLLLVMVCGLNCPEARGILVSTRGWNLRPLHWKVYSQPLDHQESPPIPPIPCFKQLLCVPDTIRNRLCLIYLRIFCVSAQTYLLTLAHNTDCPLIQMHNDQKPSLMMVIEIYFFKMRAISCIDKLIREKGSWKAHTV